ncbi:hypothetical protein FJ365_01460 [Candidatus Dependentiae bacterium]|nr:hypothetical protein [Candidatus Dependentiae bacterium]
MKNIKNYFAVLLLCLLGAYDSLSPGVLHDASCLFVNWTNEKVDLESEGYALDANECSCVYPVTDSTHFCVRSVIGGQNIHVLVPLVSSGVVTVIFAYDDTSKVLAYYHEQISFKDFVAAIVVQQERRYGPPTERGVDGIALMTRLAKCCGLESFFAGKCVCDQIIKSGADSLLPVIKENFVIIEGKFVFRPLYVGTDRQRCFQLHETAVYALDAAIE